jgi:hypothetical protein
MLLSTNAMLVGEDNPSATTNSAFNRASLKVG